MPTDALVSAPLLVAAVLVTSAFGKLRDTSRAAQAFDALGMPRALSRPWMRSAHPWAELVLAVLLIITSGLAASLSATAALALATAYLVIVLRVVRRPEPTDCACFGALGSETVTGWTVARNIWLLLLAGLAVWASFALAGRSPIGQVIELGTDAWWLAAIAAAVVMTVLVIGPRGNEAQTLAARPDPGEELQDYERAEIPHVPVTLADGTVVSLRTLAETRPKLIVAVSDWCSGCVPTIEAVPLWREQLPEVDIHLLYASHPEPIDGTPPEPQTLHDPMRYAIKGLNLLGTPSAVLLGADGFLAGGPVLGTDDVRVFIEDIEAELSSARLTTEP